MADESSPASHQLTAIHDEKSAMIQIVLKEGKPIEPAICEAGYLDSVELDQTRKRLAQKHCQWIYFDRSLRLYSRGRLYLFKPLQRVQWTCRQAILDGDELIAEALGSAPH
jgi:hypothetical protein